VIDLDGVYDPRQVNDRVLLGLKGTISEYELSLMRQRGLGARDAKASAASFAPMLRPASIRVGVALRWPGPQVRRPAIDQAARSRARRCIKPDRIFRVRSGLPLRRFRRGRSAR
jgi:hypothetical protein